MSHVSSFLLSSFSLPFPDWELAVGKSKSNRAFALRSRFSSRAFSFRWRSSRLVPGVWTDDVDGRLSSASGDPARRRSIARRASDSYSDNQHKPRLTDM